MSDNEEQASEIVGKAIEGSWKGIPLYADLAKTMWCRRKPAFPPEGDAVDNVPTKSTSAPDRSQHGKLDTSRDHKMSFAEAKAALRR